MYYLKNNKGFEISYTSLKVALEDFRKYKEEALKSGKFALFTIEEDASSPYHRSDVVVWDTVEKRNIGLKSIESNNKKEIREGLFFYFKLLT